MTDSDDRFPTDQSALQASVEPVDRPRSPGELVALAIGAVVLIAALVGVSTLGGDDTPDQVSTGTDPVGSVADVADTMLDTVVDAPVDEVVDADAAPAETAFAAETAIETEAPAETAIETDAPAETDAPVDTEPSEPVADAPPDTEAPVEATDAPPTAADTATYRVTLAVNWVAATHPTTLPGNAHFSDPVIAVHGAPGTLFAVGQPASAGIEEMAEVGRTGTLLDELSTAASLTSADSTNGIDAPATAERSFDITVTQDAPLVSLVTMLAPSPDWFVGIADQNTFVDGQWIDAVTVEFGNYDAGTDSGSGFSSDNADTSPKEPVAGPRDDAFAAAAAEAAFGTVTMTKTG